MSNRFPADDEHLHPYPGNLKHHKVDKKEQRKLLCEMMEDDAKSGLYNKKKREPLLSDDALLELTYVKEDGRRPSEQVRDYYEAARAKDAEEIAKWKGIVKGVHGALTDIGTVPVPAIDADLYDAVMSIRAKDAELIQRLVDLVFHSPGCFHDVTGYKCSCLAGIALEAAAAAGFKPTEP